MMEEKMSAGSKAIIEGETARKPTYMLIMDSLHILSILKGRHLSNPSLVYTQSTPILTAILRTEIRGNPA
jgi:hypothetical protein